MSSLRNAMVALALLSGIMFGIGCAAIIEDGGWSRQSTKLFSLGVIGVLIDLLVIRILYNRGVIK